MQENLTNKELATLKIVLTILWIIISVCFFPFAYLTLLFLHPDYMSFRIYQKIFFAYPFVVVLTIASMWIFSAIHRKRLAMMVNALPILLILFAFFYVESPSCQSRHARFWCPFVMMTEVDWKRHELSERIAAQYANDADEHFALAMLEYRRSDYGRAVQSFEAAARLDPNNPDRHAWAGKSWLCLIHAPDDCWDETALQNGLKHLQLSVQLQPTNAGVHRLLANAFTHAGDFERAVLELEEAVRLDPTPFMRTELGVSRLRKGDVDNAILDLKEVIRNNPADKWSHKWLGLAYLSILQFPEAEKNLRQARDSGSTGTHEALYLHIVLEGLGRPDEAKTEIEDCLTRCVPGEWERKMLEFAARQVGSEEFLSAATNACQRAEAHYLIGMNALSGGNRAAAETAFQSTIKEKVFCYSEHFLAKSTLLTVTSRDYNRHPQ
jgi:tetratricopeptide (TPR) repeat protein